MNQRSSGKSACQENCPCGPVCAPKSMKSSPRASTSWKFCCSCRIVLSTLCLFLRRRWLLCPCFKTAQTRRSTRKCKNFFPIILIKSLKLNSSVASHLVFIRNSNKQQIHQQANPMFHFFLFQVIEHRFAMKEINEPHSDHDITALFTIT